MNPPDEMAAKIGPTERQSAGAAAGSDDSSKEQLRAAFKEFERTSQQSEPVEELHGSDDKLDQQLHAVLEDLQRVGLQPNPVEEDEPVERDDHRPGIASYLDHEASERKAIYDRLVAIENAIKRRGSRGFRRYLVAILIGVAATLAWQSYGESAKQIVATRAPELGWSRGQANDCEFDSVDWLDETTGRSRKASGAPCADCARRPPHRPGAGAADGPRSCHTAANCGATRSRSKQTGGR